MNTNRLYIFLSLAGLALSLGILACSGLQVTGLTEPTPFVMPTSNLDMTMTAVFSSVMSTAQATNQPAATQTSAGPTTTATMPPTYTPLPTQTPYPTYTAPPPTAIVVYIPGPVIPITVIPVTYVAPTAVIPTTAPVPGPSVRSGPSVTATYRAAPPVINGDLSDWAGGSYPISNVVYGLANWTGPADLSANARFAWDNSYLYIAASVTDDAYQQLASGLYLFRGDSIEILLDANVAGDFYVTSLNNDDYQIGMTPGQKPGLIPESYMWYPSSKAGSAPWVALAADLVAGGYNIEAAIPWSYLGVAPATGQHYGFAFSVSDNDTPATTQQDSMISNMTSRHLTNPTDWGDLTLGP